jgi:hypothetical protein
MGWNSRKNNLFGYPNLDCPPALLWGIRNRLSGCGWYKGHFTLQPSVQRTRDSSNLIGGERKFVCSTFTLEANGQGPPKRLHGNTFWEFWRQKFVRSRRVWISINIVDKFSSTGQTFLSKLIQILQFLYFNGLLPCRLEGSLSEVLLTPRS